MMIYEILLAKEPTLIKEQVTDIATFCPRYNSLPALQRMNFWGQLVSAISFYESGWNPLSRFIEVDMKDPDTVTGEQVVSEGLLQLSYQDTLNHRGLCDFDWSKDMMLSVNDPRKTILDPYKNLSCGIRILARQIRSKHAIAIGKGAYWSVIKSDSSHEKISKIATITKEFSFCR